MSEYKGAPGPAIFLVNLAMSQDGLNDSQRELLRHAAKMLCDLRAENEALRTAVKRMGGRAELVADAITDDDMSEERAMCLAIMADARAAISRKSAQEKEG